MRPRCSVFLAVSLDGFIAREDGSIDWLERAQGEVAPGDDLGYAAFFAGVDALVMGRRTFDTVRGFPSWPYGDRRVVVCSRGPVAIPPALGPQVTASSASPADLLVALRAEGVGHVYVDGGETIRRFLAADLVDELTITTIPVLLGRGRPLFGPGGALPSGDPPERWLALLGSRATPEGFVQSAWRVRR